MQLHRVLINFCFYPVHLQLIVAANHPMQLQGCARLTQAGIEKIVLFASQQVLKTRGCQSKNSIVESIEVIAKAIEDLHFFSLFDRLRSASSDFDRLRLI